MWATKGQSHCSAEELGPHIEHMESEPKRGGARKTTGWLLVVMAVLWAFAILLQDLKRGADISSMIGGLMVPLLIGLGGLYVAGVIKRLK